MHVNTVFGPAHFNAHHVSNGANVYGVSHGFSQSFNASPVFGDTVAPAFGDTVAPGNCDRSYKYTNSSSMDTDVHTRCGFGNGIASQPIPVQA